MTKIQPRRFFAQSRTVNFFRPSGCVGIIRERFAGLVQSAEDTGALRRGVLGHRVGMFGALHAFINFLGMRHPMPQLIDGGLVIGQQVGKDRAGVIQERTLVVLARPGRGHWRSESPVARRPPRHRWPSKDIVRPWDSEPDRLALRRKTPSGIRARDRRRSLSHHALQPGRGSCE